MHPCWPDPIVAMVWNYCADSVTRYGFCVRAERCAILRLYLVPSLMLSLILRVAHGARRGRFAYSPRRVLVMHELLVVVVVLGQNRVGTKACLDKVGHRLSVAAMGSAASQ